MILRKMKSVWCYGTCNIAIHLRSPQEPPQPVAMGRDAISRNLWSVKGQSKATHFVGCWLSWSIGTGSWSVKYLQSVFYFQTLQESRNSIEMWTRLESRIKMLRGVALSLKVRKRSCPKWSNSRVKWSLLTLPSYGQSPAMELARMKNNIDKTLPFLLCFYSLEVHSRNLRIKIAFPSSPRVSKTPAGPKAWFSGEMSKLLKKKCETVKRIPRTPFTFPSLLKWTPRTN